MARTSPAAESAKAVTVRDHFAMAAMASLLRDEQCASFTTNQGSVRYRRLRILTSIAYEVADAMLDERRGDA